MKKLLFVFLLLIPASVHCTIAKAAKIDFVTVRVCRDILMPKWNEGETQDKANEALRDAINKAGATSIYFIQYGNDQSAHFQGKKKITMDDMLRDKENACIVATAWISK